MIIVTGGATGIGRAIANHFVSLRSNHLSDVVITGRRRDVLERAASEIGAQAVPCDSTDPESLGALVEACANGLRFSSTMLAAIPISARRHLRASPT